MSLPVRSAVARIVFDSPARAAEGGMAYATSVIVLTVVIAWTFGIGAATASPDHSLGTLGLSLGLLLRLGAPFIVVEGALLGLAHGVLTLRLAQPSAIAPIVA